MIPTFAFPGESAPGQFGPDQPDPPPLDVRMDPQHLVDRHALGDADDRLHAGVDRLVHRVRGERRRHEDHGGVRAGLGCSGGDRVEDRDALDVLTALAGRHSRDDLRAVLPVAKAVEATLGSRQPWTTSRVSVSTRMAISRRRQLHGASGAVEHRRLRVHVRRVRLTEQPTSFLGVRPVEPDDDRVLDPHLRERLQDPASNLVAAGDPAEDVEEDRAHVRVLRDDLERVDDALRVAAAAEVAEVRRPAADERHDVHGRHRQAGSVPEHPDVTVELHVGDALLAGERLQRIRGGDVAHLGEVRMPEERVVVDRELRVERSNLAVGRHDERVDLAERRIAADERVVQLSDDRHDLLLLGRILDPGLIHEPPRVPRVKALEWIHVQPDEGVRARRRDLLDVHAALRREHEERALRAAIEGDRQVVLARDLRGPLDPHLLDRVASNVHAEDLRCPRPAPPPASLRA